MPEKDAFCPSCGAPADRDGKFVICGECDMSFTVTPKETRAKEIGAVTSLRQRLDRVEAAVFPSDDPPGDPPDHNHTDIQDIPDEIDETGDSDDEF